MNIKNFNSLRLPTTRVLVVDDNATTCENLTNQLNQWGLDVSVCLQSAAAIERMIMAQRLEHPFDLVILDSCMQTMNGRDVAKAMGSQPSLKQTPIILLSSNDDCMNWRTQEETRNMIAICKPVNQNHLLDSIMTLLRRHHLIEAELNSTQPALTSASNTIATMEQTVIASFIEDEVRESANEGPSQSVLDVKETLNDSDFLQADELLEQCGGDRQFTELILQIMRETLPSRMLELEGALCAGDFDRIKHTAHQLKGAAADCSLKAIWKTASELELHADQSASREVASSLISLRLRVDRTLDLLEEFLR
ncbi:MAG: response regulator [Planctomycetota bacterium]|jgi:DNA-binding response OmpR family regulator|nr:response regulator [Planctomycetota bacterium]